MAYLPAQRGNRAEGNALVFAVVPRLETGPAAGGGRHHPRAVDDKDGDPESVKEFVCLHPVAGRDIPARHQILMAEGTKDETSPWYNRMSRTMVEEMCDRDGSDTMKTVSTPSVIDRFIW